MRIFALAVTVIRLKSIRGTATKRNLSVHSKNYDLTRDITHVWTGAPDHVEKHENRS